MELFSKPGLTSLSQELLCHVLSFLPVKDVLTMGMMCKKLLMSMKMHLHLCKQLDLCDSEVWGSIPECVTDDQLYSLLKKCPKLEAIYGLHPQKVERRRLRKKSALSIPGVIDALLLCTHLQKVETSNLQILEAISHYLPHVEIVGHFRNGGGCFPPDAAQQLKLNRYPLITSLHLIGVFVPELSVLPELKDLHLQWVRFTRFAPFKSFRAPKLKTFVMKQCLGPDFPLRYLPLLVALSRAPNLSRLELVRLPIPPVLIQRAVEESWHFRGFQNLKKLVVGDCKDILATDIGYLMIAASRSLESVSIPPSVSTDNFFASLQFAGCDFSSLKTLNIGYVEQLWPKGESSDRFWGSFHTFDDAPIMNSLSPSAVTDRGVQIMGFLFPNCENLTLSHCPHVIFADSWLNDGASWLNLRQLTLRHCPCLKVEEFSILIPKLKSIEVIILKDMFREPPKGCSHVGLSVGTGLGLSSAVVTTHDERIAVNVPDEPIELRMDPEPDFLYLNNLNNIEEVEHQPAIHENPVELIPVDNIKVEPEEYVLEMPDDPMHHHLADHDNKRDGDSTDHRHNSSANKSGCSIKEEPFDPSYIENSSSKQIDEHALNVKKEALDTYYDLCTPGSSVKRTARRSKISALGPPYKGPLTRHRSRMMLAKQPINSNRCSQGTQTCSNFIRRNLGQQICVCNVCNLNCKCCHANNTAKDSAPNRSGARKKVELCDKATSTNDPLKEDDADQDMFFESNTLKSLTAISCGLSEIYIADAPDLQHLEVRGCRILKKIYVRFNPCISRISISQCPKYHISEFLSRYEEIPFYDSFIIYLKPCVVDAHVSEVAEKCVAGPQLSPAGATFAIIHDYSYDTGDRGVYRENLLAWLKLIRQIHDASHVLSTVNKNNQFHIDIPRCPYDQHRIFGEFPDGTYYELITNNLLLATLWRRNKNSIEICPSDPASGFQNVSEVVSSLRLEIAEMAEIAFVSSSKFAGFYVHL